MQRRNFQGAKALHPKYAKVIDAEKRLNEAKQRYQKDVRDRIEQSKTLIQQGRLDEAISLAEEALKIDSANVEAKTLLDKWKSDLQSIKKHLVLIEQFLKTEMIADAERELQSAKKLNQRYQPIVDAENRLNSKKNEFKQKQAQAQRLKAEGEALERQGSLENAVGKYKESVKIMPDKSLEEHIRELEAQIINKAQKKAAADRLWDECSTLAK